MSFTSFNWIRKEPGYRNGGEHFGYLANVFLRSGYGNEVHPSRLNGMAGNS